MLACGCMSAIRDPGDLHVCYPPGCSVSFRFYFLHICIFSLLFLFLLFLFLYFLSTLVYMPSSKIA